MRVLGISCFYHDAAAALVVDGMLVAAAEEERFSRIKHDHAFPRQAVDFCLRHAGITGRDLDLVVFYEKPFQKLDRILMSALATFPRSLAAFREGMLVWLLDKLWVRDQIQEQVGCARSHIAFCAHHLSHAASAYYCSGFERAAVLTVDGVGEWATGTRGTAWDTHVELTEKMSYPHSVGLLYSAFTAFLGFQVNEGEYKVMGMAPYGEPRFADLILEKLVHLRDDGSFRLDMDYLAYHWSADRSFSDRFCELFGRPRTQTESNLLDPHYADVAASIQRATEEILLGQARHLARRTGHRDLVMAGGVALNSVANARILQESGFERMFVQPAAGDGGGALGAALWGAHALLGEPRRFEMRHCYWGEEHSDGAVADYLKAEGVAFEERADDEALFEEVAERLCQGQVVGWMRGRFEWGPRALGHRSILADPRPARMKDVVNARIKFREPFRPFAPSVLADRVEEHFLLRNAREVAPARFMLLVVPVREEKRPLLEAVTHVDGSSRIQAVHREESPDYYRLIERFGEAAGVPVVLNTSFNLRGEPIVNTPAEAYATFARSDMDALVMGRFVVSRRARSESRSHAGAELQQWSHRPDRAQPALPALVPAARWKAKLRTAAGKVATVVVGTLLGAELLVRLLVPMPNLQVGGMYVSRPDGVALRPGWTGRVHTREYDTRIRINGRGLRDPHDRPAPGLQHVLVLGDSFVFGCWSAADRTWLAQAERALGPRRVQLFSAGVPNNGTDAELDFLRRRGDEFQPDVVVLAFFNGNDFADNYFGRGAYAVQDGYLVMKDRPSRVLDGYDCLSPAAGAAEPAAVPPYAPAGLVERMGARGADAFSSPARNGVVGAGLLASLGWCLRHSYAWQFYRAGSEAARRPHDAVRLNDPQAWFLKAYPAAMRQAVDRTCADLDGVLAETRRRRIPLVLVDIPSRLEVYPEEWSAWSRRHAEIAGRFNPAGPREIIAEWARTRGVAELDLQPVLAGRQRMYYYHDMHWNDLGHFQAGERLAAFLRSRRLAPP